MKEFVEKLIDRLEEYKKQWMDADYLDGIDEIIEIVNQLAEEYGKDTNVTTNADRIRTMSDEELVELFMKLAWNGEVQTTPLRYLDWLQSEVKGSDV